jgi:enoyl-CoA hydratase/carnithine racemase
MRYVSVVDEPEAMVLSLLSHILKIDLLIELREIIRTASGGRIIIKGQNGFFAAGADIRELTSLDATSAVEQARFCQQVLNEIEGHRAVTIAAIDGYCMGGGLDLALSCDLRYATPKSVLAHPGGRIGIMTGWGGTRRLPLMIGKSRALEMMAVGRRVSAQDAAEWGLISGVQDDPVTHALNLQL